VNLSDIMSAMRLSSYAELGLLLFGGAFIAIVVYVLGTKESKDWDVARRLALGTLEEDAIAAERASRAESRTRESQ
jgi:cbb3-type cytochrome oxidase subunit 3